ncbi:MAG TPA: zinc-binding dehydrogenase, partial [Parvularculaceae bacterium]|nr:zinc-binding dehydrogenase [Parvularculaceae bacterium]
MAKAVVIHENGGPEVFRLEDRADAPLAGDEIAVANAAVGVNFIDIYQRKGLYPVTMPAVLGNEGAGRVAAVGEGVEGFAVGDRVAYLGSGAYASRVNVRAGMAAKIPAAVSDDVAAAVFLKGLTAEMLVRRVFPLQAGQTALVYAAAGGVGQILTQWAAFVVGAEVIAIVGNEEKAALAKNNGAAHVIIRTKTEAIAADVRKLTAGRGVDVVYDSVGAATFEASLDSLAMCGMMVSY